MSEKLNGLLLVDKPMGWTSHDLVNRARRLLGTKSVGHCGTLDPMASGLMVLLIGEATKLSNYVLENDKSYRVRAQLGITTDTLDTTGKTITSSPVHVDSEKVRQVALALQGELNLPVPMYSATKIDGVKLYEYARKGEIIEQPMKIMKFYDFHFLDQGADWFELEMSCSKGSYVRAWVHELGQKLGCGAAMSALVRTSSKPYNLAQAHKIEEIEEKSVAGEIESFLIPMGEALPDYRTIRVVGLDESLLANGQISHGLKSQLISVFKPEEDIGVKVLSMRGGALLALLGLEKGRGFIIKRVFHY